MPNPMNSCEYFVALRPSGKPMLCWAVPAPLGRQSPINLPAGQGPAGGGQKGFSFLYRANSLGDSLERHKQERRKEEAKKGLFFEQSAEFAIAISHYWMQISCLSQSYRPRRAIHGRKGENPAKVKQKLAHAFSTCCFFAFSLGWHLVGAKAANNEWQA